jgi:peptidoglycan/xylan/chitin deacetylase (PgdA/CDA1 family)
MEHLFFFSLIPLLAFAQSGPPWEMPEEELKERAFQVSAGKSLQPDKWPGGARVAVLLSFDVDGQTWELMSGETPRIADLSQGEYGTRVGLKRIVHLLDEHEIPASFFVPVVTMMLRPEIINLIKAPGRHELGVHGWIHEHVTDLPEGEEKKLLKRMVDYFEEHVGIRPVGYRAPGYDVGPNTISLLEELGFLYDSSLMADDRPYEVNVKGEPKGLVELPVEWMLDDATVVDPRGDNYSPPREALQVFIDEFDRAYEEGTMFLLTMHPRVIGHRSRIIILEGLIEHIESKKDIWFATHQQAAEYVKEASGKE